MPNTLAHFGVQGVATRVLVRDADPKWIALGCMLPDVPWIGRRALEVLAPGLDACDVRLYAAVQSSLLFSLLLAGALALWARRALHVAAILALNSLLHLLLDACERKWGNGVMLGAPFDWTVWSAGLFWPEAWPGWILTAAGLGWFVWAWRRAGTGGFTRPSRGRAAASAALLAAWALLPLFFLDDAEEAGVHSVAAVRDPAPGRAVELDRNTLTRGSGGFVVRTWAGTEHAVAGDPGAEPGTVSLRGRFDEGLALRVDEIHDHGGQHRDYASYAGLALLAAMWLCALRARGP